MYQYEHAYLYLFLCYICYYATFKSMLHLFLFCICFCAAFFSMSIIDCIRFCELALRNLFQRVLEMVQKLRILKPQVETLDPDQSHLMSAVQKTVSNMEALVSCLVKDMRETHVISNSHFFSCKYQAQTHFTCQVSPFCYKSTTYQTRRKFNPYFVTCHKHAICHVKSRTC